MIESINWLSELLDTGISLLGKYGRWLNAKQKRVCFVLWNICTGYWVFRNFSMGLYSQTFFCFVSIALNTYAFFFWRKKAADSDNSSLKFQWVDNYNGAESYLSINSGPCHYKIAVMIGNNFPIYKYMYRGSFINNLWGVDANLSFPKDLEGAKRNFEKCITYRHNTYGKYIWEEND